MAGYDIKNDRALLEWNKWDSNAEAKAWEKYEEEEKQGRRKGYHQSEGLYYGPHKPSWGKRHLVLLYKHISYNNFGATSKKVLSFRTYCVIKWQ